MRADAPPLPEGVRPAEGRARRADHGRSRRHRPQDRDRPRAGRPQGERRLPRRQGPPGPDGGPHPPARLDDRELRDRRGHRRRRRRARRRGRAALRGRRRHRAATSTAPSRSAASRSTSSAPAPRSARRWSARRSATRSTSSPPPAPPSPSRSCRSADRGFDLGGRRGHLGPNCWPGLRVRRWIGPLTDTAATTRPVRSCTGADTLATPSSRSPTLATHSPGSPRSTLPAEPASSGSRAPTATIVRSSWGDSSDSTQTRPSPSRTYSCTHSPVCVAQRRPAPGGPPRPAGTAVGRLVPEPDEAQAEGRSGRRRRGARRPWASRATASRWAVARGRPVRRHQLGQRAPARRSTRVEHGHRLVEHAHAAYTLFHQARLVSQM